ncbi:proline-rich receptor-like protein kinase PERK8 isoform X3 [Populus trichocarpa]|uniref:proline-rich receptor-like protein kinase PERK8 isoform X3 n=1 Tax=Populus trichocarpa TaxID=3694 RepID=UPI000D18A32A|nr:proline-rich receptor-like protein kinase PERK8 isoform X3 [Populus trichocarpa]|eukprot:XP_024441635.1 proline-rich receptor-like protein kinase PERK8 isoform X3 [Populus trichocarpa]
MSRTLAAILGGAAGVMALVGAVIFLLWCLSHKKSVSRTSETGSSETSVQGRHAGIELSLQEARRFEMEELSLATKGFSEKNLMGFGKFGEVYKGLLNNGMVVAIKKRPGAPSPEFVDEVRYLSPIQHRNLVTLLGYCQENDLQFLVYEYIPSGSVSNHLYGPGQTLDGKLEFKHRLSIALGAAKGDPLQNQSAFWLSCACATSFISSHATDAGLRNFLGKVDIAGPSTQVTSDEIFLAPEVREFRRFSEKSDVFSFGVFLLELLSGKEAAEPSPGTNQNLVEWVQNTQDYANFASIVDQRLGSSFTAEGMEEFIQLMLRCVEPSSERRPAMNYVVMELDRIIEKEMNLTTVMGEGTPTVTLGSHLFRSAI